MYDPLRTKAKRPLGVGSRSPKGDGRWGHADLAGNLWEYVVDSHADPYPQPSCTNCAHRTSSTVHVQRGSGFTTAFPDPSMLTSARLNDEPDDPVRSRSVLNGARCARSP